VRAANTLSKSLTRSFPSIVALFLYEDSQNPQYYLGRSNRSRQPSFKKLFGNAEIFHRVGDRSFLHHPLSFSQINHALLEKMVDTAARLLQPSRDARLFDLYCGYGLFALCLAENFHSVVGVETSPASIESAIANAKRQRVMNARFIKNTITGETIERVMAPSRPQDSVLLDPPRSGTDEGVIECVAARKPNRVVHIFCEIDLIPGEVKRWGQGGYTPVRAVPLDMFPGTSTIETMILFEHQ
jgi:tRNA/tmRNA/rRNA uracil-C5-methylase (TrmA/RlmC/RlmD family)